jgi:catechol 2,3-dioxygenase-like lactoylglutathione lyase family enzyme
MIRTIHHIGIAVADLAAAATFYQASAGFLLETTQPILAPDGQIIPAITLQSARCRLVLCQAAGAVPGQWRPVNEAGITHFCVQNHQIAALYQRFATAGAGFHAEPLQLATRNMYCYARDPEGNVVELEALPTVAEEPNPWVAHVALATPNLVRLAAFYHTLVGKTQAGGQELGPNPLYDTLTGLQDMRVIPTWIIGANITIELWQFLHPPTLVPQQLHDIAEPGYSHISFEVTNLAEALAVATTAGGFDATPVTSYNGILIAYIRDPDGNWLELRSK